MFKIPAEMLKGVVNPLAKSARKSGAGNKTVYISTTEEGAVSFYYADAALSVERKVNAAIESELAVATSLFELDQKVSALPSHEEILLQVQDNQLKMKWGGRDSHISVDLLPETMPILEPPTPDTTVSWKPGALHGIVRMMLPFCASPGHEKASTMPAILGIQFTKDETGEVLLRATDSFKYIRCLAAKLNWFDKPLALEARILQAVSDVLSPDAEITVGISKSGLVMFKTGLATCVTTPLNGLLPSEHLDTAFNYNAKSKIRLDRLEFIELLRRVRTVSASNKPYTILVLKNGHIVAQTPGGELVQDMSGTIEGAGVEAIAFHASHMEIAATFFQLPANSRSDEIVLHVNSHKSPITIGVDGQDRVNMTVLPVITTEVEKLNGSSGFAKTPKTTAAVAGA
jgi:DNA polymerase III sliding clamp (beta) subunit (PCNA family)